VIEFSPYVRAVVGFLVVCLPFAARGALLELPNTSARDGGIYATSAIPKEPSTALGSNPAGLTRLEGTMFTLGLQTPIAKFRYEGAGPTTGYRHMSTKVPIAPNFGFSTDRWRPWYFAIGAFGTTGFGNDFPADPANGIPQRLKNDLAVMKLAPTVAYRASPRLSIGLGLLPCWGQQEAESYVPVPGAPIVDIEADGPGIAGQLGVLAGPWRGFRVALAYRTEGKLWLTGRARIAGVREDLDVTYDLPQSVVASVAWEPRPNLTLAVQARWTDWTTLDDSEFDFEDTNLLDQPITRHSSAILAWGGGIEYVTSRGLALRASFFYDPRAIDRVDMWPNLIDASYIGVGIGLGYRFGDYQVDVFGGSSAVKEVSVGASAKGFPGKYSAHDSYGMGLQITRFWGSD
jgi:long-subunit fatty acid transport protein